MNVGIRYEPVAPSTRLEEMAGGSLKQPIRMKVSSPGTGVGDVSAAIVMLGGSISTLEVLEMAGMGLRSVFSDGMMVLEVTGFIMSDCAVVVRGSTRHAMIEGMKS